MELNFEPYQTIHQDSLVAIFKLHVPEYFGENEIEIYKIFLDKDLDENLPYFTIFLGTEIIGAGGVFIDLVKKEATLCWGFISPMHLKLGYGAKSVLFREALAKEKGALKMISDTSQKTDKFFQKLGYNEILREKDHWWPGLDLVKMEKPLIQ